MEEAAGGGGGGLAARGPLREAAGGLGPSAGAALDLAVEALPGPAAGGWLKEAVKDIPGSPAAGGPLESAADSVSCWQLVPYSRRRTSTLPRRYASARGPWERGCPRWWVPGGAGRECTGS
ncbi:hypothetical protein ACP4OV_029019 [Aristida adscensionis]